MWDVTPEEAPTKRVDRMHAEINRLNAALDAMTAEWEKEIAGRITAEAERDAALSVLDVIGSAGFIRPIVEEQSCGEWGDDIVDEDTRKIVAAIRAMKEPKP